MCDLYPLLLLLLCCLNCSSIVSRLMKNTCKHNDNGVPVVWSFNCTQCRCHTHQKTRLLICGYSTVVGIAKDIQTHAYEHGQGHKTKSIKYCWKDYVFIYCKHIVMLKGMWSSLGCCLHGKSGGGDGSSGSSLSVPKHLFILACNTMRRRPICCV